MASAFAPSFKELLLGGGISLTADTIGVALLDNTYVFSSVHDFRNDLTGVVALSSSLASKTITSGVFDAADGLASSVTGNAIVAVWLFKSTGVASTDPLIVFIDGLSLTPNGNNINIIWNASGIFAL